MTVAGRCFSRSHRDGTLYLFLLGDKGEVEQWGLATDAAGAMRGRIARRWSPGSEAGYCAADDRGSVYIAQEAVGAWRSDEHPSELQSLIRSSYAVFCLKKQTKI